MFSVVVVNGRFPECPQQWLNVAYSPLLPFPAIRQQLSESFPPTESTRVGSRGGKPSWDLQAE